jgi:hypothetical protein
MKNEKVKMGDGKKTKTSLKKLGLTPALSPEERVKRRTVRVSPWRHGVASLHHDAAGKSGRITKQKL